MYYAKKRIKPLFSDIVIDKDLYIKNNYHIYLAIIGLYAAAFGIATLIGINC
jgi:hypothetical protein